MDRDSFIIENTQGAVETVKTVMVAVGSGAAGIALAFVWRVLLLKILELFWIF